MQQIELNTGVTPIFLPRYSFGHLITATSLLALHGSFPAASMTSVPEAWRANVSILTVSICAESAVPFA